MTVDPRTPCIIGVAAHTWHPDETGEQGAPEPLAMWEHVARAAAADTKRLDVLDRLDSIQVVYCQTWQYDDAPARLLDGRIAAPGQLGEERRLAAARAAGDDDEGHGVSRIVGN